MVVRKKGLRDAPSNCGGKGKITTQLWEGTKRKTRQHPSSNHSVGVGRCEGHRQVKMLRKKLREKERKRTANKGGFQVIISVKRIRRKKGKN